MVHSLLLNFSDNIWIMAIGMITLKISFEKKLSFENFRIEGEN